MRACVIFNPAARGDKARQFARFLDTIAPAADLRPTTGPGSARLLAREAADSGRNLVIAAGGDGTVNEALQGLAGQRTTALARPADRPDTRDSSGTLAVLRSTPTA